jgi:hypothetical protein
MSTGIHVSREPGALVRVISEGPFSVGSRIWRDARGQLTCTVVAKATYALGPGVAAPLDDPSPIQEDDAHWESDTAQSVRVPGDLSPFKRTAEWVVVGSAFGARKAHSIIARVAVAATDKAIEVFPPRHARPDGKVEAGALIDRHSLRYEHAAGGPGTDNPVGVDVTRADERGFLPVPSLLPPSHAPGRGGPRVGPRGFGPIAPSWPTRAGLLGAADRAWLRQPATLSMPAAFPAAYFQVAPPDQWLDRPLGADEPITLEGLHPEVRRLALRLSGLEPRAILAGPSSTVVPLRGDLLFVDTDEELCTVTFRGTFPVSAREHQVVVVGAPVGASIPPEVARRVTEHDRPSEVETTAVQGPAHDPPADETRLGSIRTLGPVLPFGAAAPPPSSPAPAPTVAQTGSFDWVGASNKVARASGPGAAPTSTPGSVPPPLLATPKPATDHAAPPAPPSFGAAFGSVKAASDAAAMASQAAGADAARESARAFSGFAPESSTGRRAAVSLLWFDAAVAPRLRRAKHLAGIFAPKIRNKRAQHVDSPHEPRDERTDVLRVLSFGAPVGAPQIHRALADCLDEPDELDRPLCLVAGDLRPSFDELETLATTVAVVKHLAGSDKKVLASLAPAEEAIAAPFSLRPSTLTALVRQIEQAVGSLPLPPRYVPIEVERLLLEGRKYKRRTVLGALRVRATLEVGGEPLLVYLPDAVASSLPSLASFPAIALAEIIPREDVGEPQDEALLAVALGRVLRARA